MLNLQSEKFLVWAQLQHIVPRLETYSISWSVSYVSKRSSAIMDCSDKIAWDVGYAVVKGKVSIDDYDINPSVLRLANRHSH